MPSVMRISVGLIQNLCLNIRLIIHCVQRSYIFLRSVDHVNVCVKHAMSILMRTCILILCTLCCQHATKHIQLEAVDVTECRIDNKEFAFRLRPRDSKRTYYMNAPNETIKKNWMQSIKSAGHGAEASQACVIQ